MKVICWNMAAAFDVSEERRADAWAWLNDQEPDVALLQEVVPDEDALSAWGSVIFRPRYKRQGCAVLVRAGGYEAWEPTPREPWLRRISGPLCVAKPADEQATWLASVHSDAYSLDEIHTRYPDWYGDLPRDNILRCSDTDLWEIEAIASELHTVLEDSPFVLGGDLNSARLLGDDHRGENDRLFANLLAQGYVDTRPRHSAQEVGTSVEEGHRPIQLDHVFADRHTESAVTSWRVLEEPAQALGLSDHAPIEVLLTPG